MTRKKKKKLFGFTFWNPQISRIIMDRVVCFANMPCGLSFNHNNKIIHGIQSASTRVPMYLRLLRVTTREIALGMA